LSVSSDVDLVARCLQGDAGATRKLVEQFERPVFSLCLRMLRHRQDAEDVAQESLTRMVRHLAGWDGARELLPWVLAIAANRCRTALERRGRRPVVLASLPEPAAPAATAPAGIGEEVQQALAELREEHRECFVLFYEQELSILEISEIMNVPDGTIKTWLHRARKQLAERLRARGIP
jgi:RNA polymerase sigma-70 factor (ECF subfamily)